jgi:hypothetical protein
MGKAKNAKKHRKRLGQTSEPVQLATATTSLDHDAKVNLLLTNIGSIHDKKRAEACVLLANVFSKDVSNEVILEKMSSVDILNKLSMRLVDSIDMVRLHAAGAIRYCTYSIPTIHIPYTCAYSYTCTYTCTHTIHMCILLYMYMCMHIKDKICMYVRMYVRTYVCMYVCTYVCMYVCVYILDICICSRVFDNNSVCLPCHSFILF